MWSNRWKKGVDYPEWAESDVYKKTIQGGYLLEDETPRQAYRRVAKTVANRLQKKEMEEVFFDYIWKGWLCLASPVLSNTGTDKGLPISCFGIDVADSIIDIGQKNLEMMLLAKHGGGVGVGVNQIRPAGAKITGNGTSDGVVPFCKIYDSTILATNQGSVRRGAASVNINIKLLQKRKATGEPYIMFKGNVNKNNPSAYKDNALKVHMTNICSEITLHTDENHSFVCCLSSLNLSKYHEWKNSNLIYDSIWFLDGVLEEFIQKAKNTRGFENAVRSAEKGRALGLGVVGWHTYLQQKGLPFEGLLAQYETRRIFSQIKIESERASMALAEEFNEPLWCVGTGFRNTHLRAIAPTVSNSKLSGNISPGIEPWAANVFTDQSAKGTFIRKNPTLESVLTDNNLNNKKIWDQILKDGGSVQDIKALEKITLGDHDIPLKEVFRTFKEINQLELINQAGIRQQYIDQSVSLNLAFPSEAEPKFINKVHLDAWKKGIKTLYYMRTESVLRGDIAASATNEECLSCDG